MMLLDTNIVSAYLKGQGTKLGEFVAEHLATEGLAISYVTQFELRRSFEKLVRQNHGRGKLVLFEKFIDCVQVVGLDASAGEGWNYAARLWADGRLQKPARVFSDADLLIAATAAFHGYELVTADAPLAERLAQIAFPVRVHLMAVE